MENVYKKKYRIMLVINMLLVVMLSGVSYAWFTATVSYPDGNEEVVIETGSMELIFTDGSNSNISYGLALARERFSQNGAQRTSAGLPCGAFR